MLLQIVLAFIISISFGIVFNVPKHALIFAGLAGAFGWFAYVLTFRISGSDILASLIGGILVAVVSEVAALFWKFPVTIVAVPGIVMLVPGLMAYSTMESFLMGNYTDGLAYGIKTLFLAGSITIGLIITGSLLQRTKSGIRKGLDAIENSKDNQEE